MFTKHRAKSVLTGSSMAGLFLAKNKEIKVKSHLQIYNLAFTLVVNR